MNKMFILSLWKVLFVHGSYHIPDIRSLSSIEGIVTVCISVGLGAFVLCNLLSHTVIINSNTFYFTNVVENKTAINNVWNRLQCHVNALV